MNSEGKCYPFDSRGSGYGRGEGVATIVLKRLDEALQAGDPVRAVIRATGVNQDGRTSGIAFPSQEAQERLVRSVYDASGMSPQDVDYVEAHGTGTIAGDATETKSIANIFTAKGQRESALFMGSVKSNFGHLESSSGIAGLIKTVLALEKRRIPPNVDLRELKHGIDLETWNIKVRKLFIVIEVFSYLGTGPQYFDRVARFGRQDPTRFCEQFWLWRYECTRDP